MAIFFVHLNICGDKSIFVVGFQKREKMTALYCLNVIQNLRQHEEIMLYNNVLDISDEDAQEVTAYLKKEYLREAIDYPHKILLFDTNSAFWAAKTVYIAAQLMLYRAHDTHDIDLLLTDFEGECTPESALSADLCLRFLPDILVQLRFINLEDPLIPRLENILQRWHYSGISYNLDAEKLDFGNLFSAPCVQQLYINRVIEYKKMNIATRLECHDLVRANLGIYGHEFWPNFN
jgi:hypothetical protein